MRIAFIARIPELSSGGVRRVVQSLAAGLEARGHEVLIVLKKGRSGWIDFLIFPLIAAFRLCGSKIDVVVAHSSDGVFCGLLARLIKSMPAVVLHSHGWEERAFAMWEKVGLEFGNGPTEKNELIARFLRFPLLRLALRLSKLAVFVSEEDLHEVGKRYPAQSGKLAYVPNGFEPKYFYPRKNPEDRKEDSLLFVGNWTWKKGSIFLPQILKEILRAQPGVRINLVGLGIPQTLRNRIFSSWEQGKLAYHENVPYEKMGDLYRRSSLLIQPSLFEGASLTLTLLEALACGLPVVAFHYPGLEQSVKSQAPLILVKWGDWRELATQVIVLLNMTQRRKDISASAQKFVEKYRWEAIAEQWEQKLAGLVRPSKDAPA